MDAVQRMLKKGAGNGQFESTEQQKVENQVIGKECNRRRAGIHRSLCFLPMILTRCMATDFIPILPFTIRLPLLRGGMAISIGVGLAMERLGWWLGWGCGWGGEQQHQLKQQQ